MARTAIPTANQPERDPLTRTANAASRAITASATRRPTDRHPMTAKAEHAKSSTMVMTADGLP